MKWIRTNSLGKMILFVALLITGCSQSSLIVQIYPNANAEVGAFGWAGARFSQQLEKETVEDAFVISPEIQGEILWQDKTIWFRPLQAFTADVTYQVRLQGDIASLTGEKYSVHQSWSFSVREPSLLFFVPGNGGGEVLRVNADGSNPEQLTFTNNRISEFSSDRTGEMIVFSLQNDEKGQDLWFMNRDGGDQRLLVDCGQDLCYEPEWSMDAQTIAYTREIFREEDAGYQPGQVWTIDIEAGQTARLFQNDSAFGHSPSFSPDGQRLAFYDTFNNGIRILDLTSSQESFVPTVIPGSGDWSPDGSKLIFTDLVEAENEPFVAVYVLELGDGSVEQVFAEGAADTDFSQPRWSPNGDWAAVSLRPVNSNIAKTLWVMRLDGSVTRQISDDQTATFTAYEWDPWGDRLVYQRYDLSSGNSSIWVWGSGKSVQIVEYGTRPQWLP